MNNRINRGALLILFGTLALLAGFQIVIAQETADTTALRSVITLDITGMT